MRLLAVPIVLLFLIFHAMPPAKTRAQSPPSPYGAWCGVEVVGETRNRHVFGTVDFECSLSCPAWNNWVHSFPFGNWGVISNFSGMHDGRQFMGWQSYNSWCDETLDDPEWNSCTSQTAQTPGFFNYNNNTEQYSSPVTPYGAYWVWESTSEEEGCLRFGQVHTSISTWNNFMELYELDPIGDDRRVTTLTFPSQTLDVWCSGVEQCGGSTSEWENNNDGNPVVSAQQRARIGVTYLYREGKG